MGRTFGLTSESDVRLVLCLALDIIKDRFPARTTEIKICEEEYGLSIEKRWGYRGTITKEKCENHKPGLFVREVQKPEHNEVGAILNLENGHSIHLSGAKTC